jgi:hypothetical protein
VTVVARSLDDLDRLAFRLSRTVRTQYPQLLTQGFTLTDLEERLLPYREVRREMADGGADAFETAVLRLVAGERGYLVADAALQAACRQALGLPSPTLALIRTWTSSVLQLSRPSGSTPAGNAAVTSARATGETDRVELFPAPRAAAPATPGGAGERAPSAHAQTTHTQTTHAHCRFCSNRLPDQRRVTFCPHCGMDLTKRQCAACSTELEVHWRFCVTCGRRDG